MEFKVPQFIDIEDKIFGPLTFVQAVYVVGGVFLAYIFWNLTFLPRIVSFLFASVAIGFGLLLAFYPKDKYGKTFVALLEAGFFFHFVNPKLYTWKRIPKTAKKREEQRKKRVSVTVPNISESNLKSLSWGLDVKKEL